MIYSAVLRHLEIKINNIKITAAYKVMEWWTDLYTIYSNLISSMIENYAVHISGTQTFKKKAVLNI